MSHKVQTVVKLLVLGCTQIDRFPLGQIYMLLGQIHMPLGQIHMPPGEIHMLLRQLHMI